MVTICNPVQRVLEIALHDLTTLHGLHVTDVPDVKYTWEIDNSGTIELLEKTLKENF